MAIRKKGLKVRTQITDLHLKISKSCMTAKGVRAYRRANPGSKLKTAVTGS